MKAYTCKRYGPPEVLILEEVAKPVPSDDQILIQNFATTVNSADIRLRAANPWLVRLMLGLTKPKYPIGGVVYSGYIIDEHGMQKERISGVNFDTFGGYGQYLVTSRLSGWGALPDSISFEDGASILFGGHTALHYLRKANIQKGESVLIYGASGSVGVSAIQLAKYFGAQVTAVCSTANLAKVKALGADNVIDYTTTDLNTLEEKYDIVYDTVGKGNEFALAKLVKPGKSLILGAAIIKGAIKAYLAKIKYTFNLIIGVAETNQEDIEFLIHLLDSGVLTAVIDRRYEFVNMRDAHEYVDKGHKSGNVVVVIDQTQSK